MILGLVPALFLAWFLPDSWPGSCPDDLSRVQVSRAFIGLLRPAWPFPRDALGDRDMSRVFIGPLRPAPPLPHDALVGRDKTRYNYPALIKFKPLGFYTG